MAVWRVNNSTLLGGEVCAPWQTNHAYALGARVVCRIAYATTTRRAYVYECTTAGTSHATTEPTWPTSGTVNDNDVVWTTRQPNDGNWDNASCILSYVMNFALPAAGDFVYIHYQHNESTDMNTYYIIRGSSTIANPIKIISVNKVDDSSLVGAYVKNNAASASYYMDFYYSLYSYGVTFCSVQDIMIGSTGSGNIFLEGNGTDVLELITASKYLRVGSSTSVSILAILNGNIKFGQITNIIWGYGYYFQFLWEKGKLVAANGVSILWNGTTWRNGFIRDVDLSDISNVNPSALCDATDSDVGVLTFSRCKLPSGVGFTPMTGAWAGYRRASRVRFHHCSEANKTYDFLEACYEGTIEDEIVIVRTGGASDGTTPQSWKIISSANVIDNYFSLESPPIHGWTDSTTEKTFTIECIVDSAVNLQNDEVWMGLEYPANNTDGLGEVARDKCAILGAPADKPSSVVTWEGTGGMANPNKFKCRVTVTPGKKGPITARIYLAKASTTIYVDPMITES